MVPFCCLRSADIRQRLVDIHFQHADSLPWSLYTQQVAVLAGNWFCAVVGHIEQLGR